MKFLNFDKNKDEALSSYIRRVKDLGAAIEIESFNEYLNIVNACHEIKGSKVYRGQANKEWPVVSGTYRCFEKEGIVASVKNIENYTMDLMSKTRKLSDERIDSNIDDLDLLAEIQHYGGETILLDFSYSPLIALFFGCKDTSEKSIDKDSAVYIMFEDYSITSNESSEFNSSIHTLDDKISADELFNGKYATYIWQPPNLKSKNTCTAKCFCNKYKWYDNERRYFTNTYP